MAYSEMIRESALWDANLDPLLLNAQKKKRVDGLHCIERSLFSVPSFNQAKEQGKAEVEELLSKLEKVRHLASHTYLNVLNSSKVSILHLL